MNAQDAYVNPSGTCGGGTPCFTTISAAVAAATPGDVIQVEDGTYNENVTIDKALTLQSENGRATTTIQGSDGGPTGTIFITGGASGVTINGFTVVGYDGASPGIEEAAIYFDGAITNTSILNNEVVADGEAGLLTEFGAAINNIIIDNNIFSGQTFVGATPGDCGFSNQFTVANVPRQLVAISGNNAMNVDFTNNMIIGTAGAPKPGCNSPVDYQGNTLATIDVINANITGNTFSGTTGRFATMLRARGTNTTISGNTFDGTNLGPVAGYLFTDADALDGATPSDLEGVIASNTFVPEAFVSGNSLVVCSLPDAPVPTVTEKAFCLNADLGANLENTGVRVDNTVGPDQLVVWILTAVPAGSAYSVGDEFTSSDCTGAFNNYGELAVANSSKVIRVQDTENAPVGTYEFTAVIEDCATGCRSEAAGTFMITVNASPLVEIMADPDGDLCLGQMDVQYSADITSTDGGTYSYAWCAYNSGDDSGTCFNGFDDNTAAMPTRDWVSSAGAKSVGVKVMSDVAGCEAEDLYSFNVVAPTVVECPMDMEGTLLTDDVTFDCAATFDWNHPEVAPGPCDPVTLTITISGGSVAEGPTSVTPGDPYSYTFEELGVFTVTYDLVDAVGNTSSCSFTVTVDGLPCGWVDNGGIGCADDLNSSSFDQGSETFSVTANNCAPTGWPYNSDQLAFVFTELCGDGEIVARVSDVSGTGFAGVMMRDSEAPNAPFMAMGTNGVNKVLKQVRILPGYPAFPQFVLSYDQFWVRIVRSGNQLMGFASTDGVSWTPYLNQQVFMSNYCLRVGLFTYSEKPDSPITATFDNVMVTEYSDITLAALPNSTIAPGTSMVEQLQVNCYPNPTSGELNIDLGTYQGEQVEVQLFNSLGQQVLNQQIDNSAFAKAQLDLSGFNTGIYNITIKLDNTIVTKKIVLTR